jgi:hypothetical protein
MLGSGRRRAGSAQHSRRGRAAGSTEAGGLQAQRRAGGAQGAPPGAAFSRASSPTVYTPTPRRTTLVSPLHPHTPRSSGNTSLCTPLLAPLAAQHVQHVSQHPSRRPSVLLAPPKLGPLPLAGARRRRSLLSWIPHVLGASSESSSFVSACLLRRCACRIHPLFCQRALRCRLSLHAPSPCAAPHSRHTSARPSPSHATLLSHPPRALPHCSHDDVPPARRLSPGAPAE